MEKIDMLLWIVGAGFGVNFAIMMTMWNGLHKRIDDVESNLSNRIDKLDEKVTDIDRRLCRLEGAFSSKDCCMIKDDRTSTKEAS